MKISADGGHRRDVEVPQSLGCVHMNITMLHNGTLVALFAAVGQTTSISAIPRTTASWSVPQATELPNNNSSIQVTTLASGELALVYNAMSAAGAVERRASLYDEIDDGDDSRKEPTAVGRSAFWGPTRADDGSDFCRWWEKLAVAAQSR